MLCSNYHFPENGEKPRGYHYFNNFTTVAVVSTVTTESLFALDDKEIQILIFDYVAFPNIES